MHQRPTLKDLYNSTQNFEMKKMQNEREKKNYLWTQVSLQYPQNYSVDLVNDSMKSKLLQISLSLIF